MGQKVNPFSFRLGNLYTWSSRWFSDKKGYRVLLLEDIKLRKFLQQRLRSAGLTKVDIERSINSLKLILHVSRPGVVIGRGGSGLEELKKNIEKILETKKEQRKFKVEIQIEEVKKPDLSAQLVLNRLIDQLEKRYPHRRAIAQALDKIMQAGAKGAKIILAGRINGAEISRTEKYSRGSVPLHTLRANIDYAEQPALTRSGYVGIKVYIYLGEES
jgi:small subunit ribosomal protein S3